MKKIIVILAAFILALTPCFGRIDVILDSDANNELDDQHAIAYLLLNRDIFNVLGITTNATKYGGPVEEHTAEAERVVEMMGVYGKGIRVYSGANSTYNNIAHTLRNKDFDGHQAVNFIVGEAKRHTLENKLTIIAVGKMTNVALATKLAPDISENIRLVWLGTNYPLPGEYNMQDDIPAMNHILDSRMELQIATVRYGKKCAAARLKGTSAISVTMEEVQSSFAGKGPRLEKPVAGRHGGEFYCFGDYSVNLFSHIKLEPDRTRALFDVGAVAVVKNPSWARATEIPAPIMIEAAWVERKDNTRKITILDNFNHDAIVRDFTESLSNSKPFQYEN